jgi:Fe-S-cluster containining protein
MEKQDCSCNDCVSACKNKPGIFKPREAEKAAELLGIPWEEFKAKFLMIDYWCAEDSNDQTIYYYAPRKTNDEPGMRVASWAYAFQAGPCVFLENDRCKIHAAKPFECREAMICGGFKNHKKQAIGDWRKAENPLRKEAEQCR